MITRYVNTASTPGGDGTTNATSGASRAFASLSEFESSMEGSMTDDITCLCCGSAADTDTVQFAGWTSNSKIIYITGDQDWTSTTNISTSKYRMNFTSSGNGLDCSDDDMDLRVDHVGFYGKNGTTERIVQCYPSSAGSSAWRFYKCVFHGDGAISGGKCKAISMEDYQGRSYAWDCVFRNLYMAVEEVEEVYNCDIIACSVGASEIHVNYRNDIHQNNTDDTSGTITGGGYSLTDKGSADWGGSGNVVSSTLTFQDKPNYDYHLVSGDSAAMSAGIGPGSDAKVQTTDIDGDSRSGSTCDIGCDEYVAAGGRVYDFMPFFEE